MQKLHGHTEFMHFTHNPNAGKRHYHPAREAQGVHTRSWTSIRLRWGISNEDHNSCRLRCTEPERRSCLRTGRTCGVPTGRREIHHVRIWRTFRRWVSDGCFNAIFEGSVLTLHQAELLDVSIIHGDGTTTAAKRGGDNIGFNGHKKIKGDKVVAFCDRNCNVIAPFISAPGNLSESPLLRDALPEVTRIAGSIALDLRGPIVSLDGVYDCSRNRKAIFNRGMVPNINPNPRNRQSTKRGRKPFFDAAIFKERFNTIERVFGWEDKFRHLLLRFERLSELHYAFKSLAYAMINLRHFC